MEQQSDFFMNFCDFDNQAKSGCDGHYIRLNDELGVKILKRGKKRSDALKEYAFTYYASSSNNTVQVLACGTALYVDKFNLVRPHPVIYMKHIPGVTVYEKALILGHNHNVRFNNEEAIDWAKENKQFAHILNRIDEIVLQLKNDYRLSMHDHESKWDNFIVDDKENVRAIDFSSEWDFANQELRQKVFAVCEPIINLTVPPKELLYNI